MWTSSLRKNLLINETLRNSGLVASRLKNGDRISKHNYTTQSLTTKKRRFVSAGCTTGFSIELYSLSWTFRRTILSQQIKIASQCCLFRYFADRHENECARKKIRALKYRCTFDEVLPVCVMISCHRCEPTATRLVSGVSYTNW